jgi:signal transduction histidine kinase
VHNLSEKDVKLHSSLNQLDADGALGMLMRWRAALPVLGLIALIAAAGFLLLGDIARDQDAIYAATTNKFVQQAVDAEIESNTGISTEYSSWDDAYVKITLEDNQAWAQSNFFSTNSSAIFVVRPTARAETYLRFTYIDAKFQKNQSVLTRFASKLIITRNEKSRSGMATTYSASHPNGLVSIDGKLASVAVLPLKPSPENHEKLFVPNHPMDYVIVITFVSESFVEKTQRAFGLEGLKLRLASTQPNTAAYDDNRLGIWLKDSAGSPLAQIAWDHKRPGSSAFASRIVPIAIGLLLLGLLTILVTEQIVSNQLKLVDMARQAAEDGSKAKSSFLANVSHELRTPLNAIIGFAEIIDEDCTIAGNKETAGDARKVSNSAQHLLGLINDLLDHSKIEAGKMDMDPNQTPLHPLVLSVSEVLESHVSKNNSQLIVRCDPDIGDAMIDAMRLKQCLLNLVSNAAKFTKNGTVTLAARPVEKDGVPFVRITVKDTGIGMSATTLAKLFVPFVQANEATATTYGGTGLGLVITRRLIEAMGGSVDVESVEGKGSTFTLLVPRGMAWDRDAAKQQHKSALAA